MTTDETPNVAPSEALTPEPVELVTTDATHVETASEPLAPDEVEVVVSYRHKGKFRLLLEWVGIIVVALSAAFLIRLFVFQTFYIPSISMVPTLQVGDRIIVSKLSTELGGVHRGDVVVFQRPPAENCGGDAGPTSDLVKRVIGLPGDHITSRGNQIIINGKVLNQPWKHAPTLGNPIGSVYVPKGQYFMMGDNRPSSCDSRIWGTLPKKLIIGKVVLRIWPLSSFGRV